MKKVMLLMLLLVIILSCINFTACTCGKENDIISAITNAQGQAQDQQQTPAKTNAQSTKPSGGGDAESFGDIPVYPGAKQVIKMSGDEPLDGQPATAEHRMYTTSDSTDKVAAFYKKEMPNNGWNETFWSESDVAYMGSYEKNNEQSVAVIGISSDQEGGSNINVDKKTVK